MEKERKRMFRARLECRAAAQWCFRAARGGERSVCSGAVSGAGTSRGNQPHCHEGRPVLAWLISCSPVSEAVISLQRACRAAFGKPARGRQNLKDSPHPRVPRLPQEAQCLLTKQRLDGAAALLQSIPRVRCGEEDSGWKPTGWRIQPEAHCCQQGLPARDATNFILDALLRGVHGVVLPTVDALQGLLHLRGRWGG